MSEKDESSAVEKFNEQSGLKDVDVAALMRQVSKDQKSFYEKEPQTHITMETVHSLMRLIS